MASPYAKLESWPRSSGGAPGGERCDFLRSAMPYGEVRVEDGKLAFEFTEPPPIPRSSRAVTHVPDSLYWGWRDQMSEAAEELRAAGFMKIPCDRGHAVRVTLVDGTVLRMTRN